MPPFAVAAWQLGGLAALLGVLAQVPAGSYACPNAPGCGIMCAMCHGRRLVRVVEVEPEGRRVLLAVQPDCVSLWVGGV